MADQDNKRNSFIDLIKFCFAILIVLFHATAETGLVPGGRIAVEGFFMITGYLMMKTIQKQQTSDCLIGKDTVSFLWRKLSLLLPYLIPSAIIAFLTYALYTRMSFVTILKTVPMLFFEIFPLKTEGFIGAYYIGISWYLSSMLLALMILYPLCRLKGSAFILGAGIPIVLVIYGYCSYKFGHIGIADEWFDYFSVRMGTLRGIAGCLSGCILFEASTAVAKIELSQKGNICFIILEIIGYVFFMFILQKYPRSKYDYLLVFVLFFLLLVGLSGITSIGKKLKTVNLRFLGTWSTLFVLNHYYWVRIVKSITEEIGTRHLFLLFYFIFIGLTSMAVWRIGLFLQSLAHGWMKELFKNRQ